MKKIIRAMGIDGGNSSIKIYNNGKTVSYENLYCERLVLDSKLDLATEYDMNSNQEYNLDEMLDVSVTKPNGVSKQFIFGKQAAMYRKHIKERENMDKSTDSQLIDNCIVAIVNTILEELKPSELDEVMNMEVYLTTGLPFKEYKKENRERYANAFLGKHTVEFLHPKYPVKKVNIEVKGTTIDIEGMAALRQTIFDKKLIKNENLDDLVDRVVSIIDIGCFTTDIVGGVFAENEINGQATLKLDYNISLCEGVNQGIGTAMDLTIKALYDKYPQLKDGDLSRTDILKALKNTRNKNELSGRRGISIEPEFTLQCKRLAMLLADKYVKTYSNSGYQNSIYKIYFTGGGVLTNSVVEQFKSLISSEIGNNLVEILDEPIYQNAKGYNSIAQVKYKNKLIES